MERLEIGRRGVVLKSAGSSVHSFSARSRRALRLKVSTWGMLFVLVGLMTCVSGLHAQTTASLSGAVTDPTGAVIPGAKITLTNDSTGAERVTITNGAGEFIIPALIPDKYSIHIAVKGFKSYEQHGLQLTAGAAAQMPPIKLAIGSAAQTVTVRTTTQILPTVDGEHAAVLTAQDIHKLALNGRDVSQLLKILPGVTTTPTGLGNSTGFSPVVTAASSVVGKGIVADGAPYRGGTTQLMDGVNITDPGCNCNAIATVNPAMTQEVTVETSNFGAESPFGPILISSISKSGGAKYHGEGYFIAKNDVLNANDWQSKHEGKPRGNAHFYYPGFNVGGPVPGTHKKLRFWFGFERDLQDLGNAAVLKSFIPTADMMSGNFGPTAANSSFCVGASNINSTVDSGCNDLTGTVLPDGTVLAGGGGAGSQIPQQFIDPGAKVLASFWPKANANPATTPGYYNYYQIIPSIENGWLYRVRMDYSPSPNTQMFISYQQGFTKSLANGNGAHIYYTPANSIPYPGGGLESYTYTKALAGHLVHTFGPNLTNDLIVAWGYMNAPVSPNNPSAATRNGLGYPYGTLFNTGSDVLPSYNTAGNFTFPDFSQPDDFENSSHSYLLRKEIPSLADNLTWQVKQHTIKMGVFMQEVSNDQGGTTSPNGHFTSFNMGGTALPNVVTGQVEGSPKNPTANFLMGIARGYTENNISKNQEMAFGDFAAYYDDTWHVTKKLSVEYGMRLEHIGHWYDKNKVGMAVFMPSLVQSDYNSGRLYPGVRWHAVDPGVPSSGMPNRFAYMTPRFGMSYDVFGNGKTLIRGGWGIFRFADQRNSYVGALETSQEILGYNLTPQYDITLAQAGQAGAVGGLKGQNGAPGISTPTADCGPNTGVDGSACINPGAYALNPTDDQIPDTTDWNLTVDQQLPKEMLFQVAYIGNHAENLPVGSESLSQSGFGAFDNQNKIPIGAFFKPDPVTGLIAKNPEQVTATCSGNVCNQVADYQPFGKEYGSNPVYVLDTAGYSNYDALQLALERRGNNVNFNVNWTYQNNLSTGLSEDPFHLRRDYGPAVTTRRYVFNFSGSYTFQRPYKGENMLLRGAANGWTLSNITTWQSGGFLTSVNNPNFGMSLQYADYNGAPVTKKNPLPNGATGPNLGSPTYYGTNAGIEITPLLTCNPQAHLSPNQLLNYSCFAPPKVGQYGPVSEPYTMVPYFDSDMSLYKSFHVWRDQHVQFRIEAFNWLNHPLRQFSSGNQLSLHYEVPYGTNNFEPLAASYPAGNPSNFGVLDQKNGAPNQRIIQLSVKYLF